MHYFSGLVSVYVFSFTSTSPKVIDIICNNILSEKINIPVPVRILEKVLTHFLLLSSLPTRYSMRSEKQPADHYSLQADSALRNPIR